MILALMTYESSAQTEQLSVSGTNAEQMTNGEFWSTANWLKPHRNFTAGRPKAALFVWFFGAFRCGLCCCLFFFLLGREK